MDWFTGIIVFLLTWWVVIFCVLPFGLKRDETGKPEKAHMGRVILITTGISGVLWLGIFGLIEADILSFREMAQQSAQKDQMPPTL
ncbi:MAG: hypothetical protein DHS20C02_06410 [Micavibrio sp.]|nr:MAG: hypothetical protein DHS20C02_06410 [Micavibrio sp.]